MRRSETEKYIGLIVTPILVAAALEVSRGEANAQNPSQESARSISGNEQVLSTDHFQDLAQGVMNEAGTPVPISTVVPTTEADYLRTVAARPRDALDAMSTATRKIVLTQNALNLTTTALSDIQTATAAVALTPMPRGTPTPPSELEPFVKPLIDNLKSAEPVLAVVVIWGGIALIGVRIGKEILNMLGIDLGEEIKKMRRRKPDDEPDDNN